MAQRDAPSPVVAAAPLSRSEAVAPDSPRQFSARDGRIPRPVQKGERSESSPCGMTDHRELFGDRSDFVASDLVPESCRLKEYTPVASLLLEIPQMNDRERLEAMARENEVRRAGEATENQRKETERKL